MRNISTKEVFEKINERLLMQTDTLAQNKSREKNRSYWTAWIGVALEYYDSGLYWLMIPFLNTVFLPFVSNLDWLIITYAMYPLSVFSRPIGASLIGRIGDRFGRKKALIISITGTALITGLVGCLPTYEMIGIFAPILFFLFRILQKFFVAGEYNGGAIFTLEHTEKKKGLVSGTYCMFTVLGIFSAAVVVTLVTRLPQGYWRLAYLLGFVTAIIGFFIRVKAVESPEFEKKVNTDATKNLREKIQLYRKEIFSSIAVATCFSALCTLPSSFTNTFIPMVTHFTNQQIIALDTLILLVYMLFFLVSGRMADKVGLKRSMTLASFAIIGCICPLFVLLKADALWSVLAAKVGLSALAAWFIGPFHAWIQELYHVNSRYEMISITYSLGSQIGAFSNVLSLWLWKQTHYVGAPGLVSIFFALVGLCGLWLTRQPTRIPQTSTVTASSG